MAREAKKGVGFELTGRDASASSAFKRLGAAAKASADKVTKASAAMTQMSVATEGAASRMATMIGISLPALGSGFASVGLIAGAMTAGVAKGLWSMTKATADARDEIFDLSRRFAVSVETISGLKFAAEQNGASVQDMGKAMQTLSKNAMAGSLAFNRWGVEVRDSNGQLKTQEEIFFSAIDAINSYGSDVEKTVAAQDIFGDSGANLLQVIRLGSDAIREQMERGKEYNAVTEEQAVAANKFNNELAAMDTAFEGLKQTLGGELVPTFTGFFQTIGTTTNVIKEYMGELRALNAIANPLAMVFEANVWVVKKLGGMLGDGADAARDQANGIKDAGHEAESADPKVKTLTDSIAGLKKAAGPIEITIDTTELNEELRLAQDMERMWQEDRRADQERTASAFTSGTHLATQAFIKDIEFKEKQSLDAYNDEMDREKQKREIMIGLAGSVAQTWGSAFGQMAADGKASSKVILNAVLSTAERAVMAYAATAATGAGSSVASTPGLGPILAPIAASAIFAAMRAYISKFERGGVVGGMVRGGMRGRDSVPVLAQDGEGFLSVNDTGTIKDLIAALRGSAGSVGGSVGGQVIYANFKSEIPYTSAEAKRTIKNFNNATQKQTRRGVNKAM